MPDDDWALAQGTVDFRNEERRAYNAGPPTLRSTMTTTDRYTTTIGQDEIISDDEVATLNAARTLAVQLAARARKLSYDDRVKTREGGSDTPGAFELGLVVAHYEDIETAVFQALNITRSYARVPLTDEQMHNRPQDAA